MALLFGREGGGEGEGGWGSKSKKLKKKTGNNLKILGLAKR